MQDSPEAHELIRKYNYPNFIVEDVEPWLRFDESPPLGKQLPDFPLVELDGDTIDLSDVWSSHMYTVIEFGSFT